MVQEIILNAISCLVHCLPGVGGGKSVGGPVVPVDLELLDAVHALQGAEALQGHLARARHELEELGALGLVESSQSSPEPLDLREQIKIFNIHMKKTFWPLFFFNSVKNKMFKKKQNMIFSRKH